MIKHLIIFILLVTLGVFASINDCLAQNNELTNESYFFEREVWKALPCIPKKMKKHNNGIKFITIHHTEGKTKAGSDEKRLIYNIQQYHMSERQWGDIAYHYLVGPSGNVYSGRDSKFIGDTGTNYNTDGHLLISLMGNFNVQQPTESVKTNLVKFVVNQLIKYRLTPKDIKVHRDVADTDCPGKILYTWLKSEGLKQISEKYDCRIRTNKN